VTRKGKEKEKEKVQAVTPGNSTSAIGDSTSLIGNSTSFHDPLKD